MIWFCWVLCHISHCLLSNTNSFLYMYIRYMICNHFISNIFTRAWANFIFSLLNALNYGYITARILHRSFVCTQFVGDFIFKLVRSNFLQTILLLFLQLNGFNYSNLTQISIFDINHLVVFSEVVTSITIKHKLCYLTLFISLHPVKRFQVLLHNTNTNCYVILILILIAM